jgi:LuxR family transcriptional regulator, maltose regulon positive regulatory protein
MGPDVRWEQTGAPAVVSGGVVYRPRLFERLVRSGRVTEVSAPAGSGKTVLLRSWVSESGLADRAGWVPVQRDERDPQRFWVSVADALRGTGPGSVVVEPVTAAPGLDGWEMVERLLKDLAELDGRIWLVIDDVHELRSADVLRQLELLVMRAPPDLRLVLVTRHDLGLGLHRLRLEGELTEIRAADLMFTGDEARALLADAGVKLPEPSMALLLGRTEGWAAGLRLAALSLAGHADPEGFVAGFSGSERTVAEYLLAEVLDRQPKAVRRLLLRTSVLDRVNGELADLLTGRSGGSRILQDLEAAGAFVVSVDTQRHWFRYHHLFADLLQFQLQAAEPEELPALHAAAANWFAGHGFVTDAVRHAQAAGDWGPAARVLADNWLGLALSGQASAAGELLARFPADLLTTDAELTTLRAAYEVTRGSLEEAEQHLQRAAALSASVPADRRGVFGLLIAGQRLRLARKRNDVPSIIEEAQQLLSLAGTADVGQPGRGEDARAVALVSLGTAELISQRLGDADRHLEQGVAVARRIDRPFIEVTGLAQWASAATYRSLAAAAERGTKAIELAERHGWTQHQALSAAYTVLANVAIWQGQIAEAERWLAGAERVLRAKAEPVNDVMLHYMRGVLELVRGRYGDALGALRAADKHAESLVTPHPLARQVRALLLLTLLRLGDTSSAEQSLAGTDASQRGTGEMCAAAAALRLAQGDPHAALRELAPVLDGSARPITAARIGALVVGAIAFDAAGDPAAAKDAVEYALELAEPDGIVLPFLLHPAPQLLEQRSRQGTAHAALVLDILGMLAQENENAFAAARPGKPASGVSGDSPWGGSLRSAGSLRGSLSATEMRVLRYLPTNLTTPEIAGELYLSANTIKTHIRHLYDKLGAHRRAEAVAQARALGLLAPSHRR